MKRVWIYQADRFLTDAEVAAIQVDLAAFVASWTAHGSALAGKGTLLHRLFLILEVDEEVAGVTGCSIDKSVHFIKGLGQKYGIDFFDRMKVSYFTESNEVALVSRSAFEELVKTETVSAETLVFNNLIQSAEELATNWIIPFKSSWHSKVF